MFIKNNTKNNLSVYIILCGGKGERWGEYQGIKKHNINILGEKLIDRTTKLIKEYDPKSLIYSVISNEKDIATINKDTIPYIPPIDLLSHTEADKFLSSHNLWNKKGKTIILFGDVWYSKKAIKKIIYNTSNNWRVFGRQKKSNYTNCNHGELFAWSFWDKHHESYLKKLNHLTLLYLENNLKVASGWGLYNLFSSTSFLMNRGKVIKGYALFSNFVHINDFTDDFDYPNDYHTWIKRYLFWENASFIAKSYINTKEHIRLLFIKINNIFFELCVLYKNNNNTIS